MGATLKRRVEKLEAAQIERQNAIFDKIWAALSDDEVDAIVVVYGLEAGSIAPDWLPVLRRWVLDPVTLHANYRSAYKTGRSALESGEAACIGWPTLPEMADDFDKVDVGGTWAALVAEAAKAFDNQAG